MIKIVTCKVYIRHQNKKRKHHKGRNLGFTLKYPLLFMSTKHFLTVLFCYVVLRWARSAGKRNQPEEININFPMAEPGSFSHFRN